MTDLRQTIIPKSDQLNADDLIGQTKTIAVTKVSLCGEADQPIAVHYEGDNGKPYKPCKSMRRVMVQIWGPDGNKYAGRRMTLYRDPKVKWGGLEVGGIRISHMSDIDKDVTMALTETRANRKPFTVRPLAASAPAFDAAAWEATATTRIGSTDDLAALAAWWNSEATMADRKAAASVDRELAGRVRAAFDAKASAGEMEGV